MSRTDITKTPMYLLERKKTRYTSEQYYNLIGYTNHVTAENKWEYNLAVTCKKYIRALGNTVFLLVRLIMWQNKSEYSIAQT